MGEIGFYNSYYKFLYEDNSSDKSFYNVDKLLFIYQSESFNNIYNIHNIYNNFKNINITFQKTNDVNNRIIQKEQGNLEQLKLYVNQQEGEHIFLKTSRDPNYKINSSIFENTVTNKEIDFKLKNETIEASIKDTIIESFSMIFFKESLKEYSTNNLNIKVIDSASTSLKDTIKYINFLANSDNKIFTIFDDLTKTFYKIAFNILSKKTVEIKSNLLSDFTSDIENGYKGSFYYLIRSKLIENIKFRSETINITNMEEIVFLKKILCDLYLKTCIPIIHYTFVEILADIYNESGDYVNSRLAVLAKIFISVNLINVLLKDSTEDLINLKRYRDNILTYLSKISSINERNVLTSVKELSKKTNETSKTINDIKEELSDNQKVLRTILSNIKSHNSNLFWNNIFLYFIIFLTLLILIWYALVIVYFENKIEMTKNISIGIVIFTVIYFIYKATVVFV